MIARASKVLFALCAALAVLAGGAWMGGAFAPAAEAAPGRPSRAVDDLQYGSAGLLGVGDALEVNGQPMQLSLFYTSDPPERVIGFYTDAFRARGLVPVVSTEPNLAHVSTFDAKDGLQRFISALPQPGGQTLVLLGITNPQRPPHFLNGAKAASFPVPDENRAFLGYRSEDAGAHAESAQFVTSLTPAEVAAFYRKQLPAQGWGERAGESTASMLLFGKGGATLAVALQALDDKKGAAVFVNRIEGGAR